MTASPASAEERQSHVIKNTGNNGTTVTNEAQKKNIKKRNWQIFPGRNKFYCDGRIMMAKQTGVLYFTVSLIVVTVALFYAFDCRLTLVTDIYLGFLIPISGGLLFLFTMFCLLRTAWSDPGVIPRASPEEAAYIEKCIQANEAREENSSNYRSLPRTLDVVINGSPLKLKFCFTCKIFRPPRASHCSLCDNCVDNFDHHCPWVGNCVGRRNYRFFYLFVTSLSVLCLFVFSFAVVNIVLLSQKYGFVEALKQSPGSLLEIVVCFFSVWSVLGLAGFHSYLIVKSLTTNEDIKGTWSKKRDNAKNPFDQGNLVSNCCYALCSPLPPSLIRRREFASDKQIRDHEMSAQRQNGLGYGSAASQPPLYTTTQSGASYPRQPPPHPENFSAPQTLSAPHNNLPQSVTPLAENSTSPDDQPSITITHQALPTASDSTGPVAHFSYNSNNSTPYQYTNYVTIDDDVSSQPGVVIEHLGPGSLLPAVDQGNLSSPRSALIDEERHEDTLPLKLSTNHHGPARPAPKLSPV